jgi:pyruvate/2-oxoglutarate dehydrogenase complex dihydrolipoamide dehydrogenase (E3) component
MEAAGTGTAEEIESIRTDPAPAIQLNEGIGDTFVLSAWNGIHPFVRKCPIHTLVLVDTFVQWIRDRDSGPIEGRVMGAIMNTAVTASAGKRFDAIIIGTGQAGPPLAARFAGAGKTVAIIERGKFGGTCVNTGCTPTKTLVASAYAIHVARRGAEYGFSIGDMRVDMARVKARKDAASAKSSKGVEEWLRGTTKCTVIQGQARFQSSNTIMVNDEVLQAEKIYINVGGRAFIPDMPGVRDVPFLTNSSIMDIDFLPGHLIIVGGSYVGLEFAQIYRRLGSEVTIVEMGPRLIGREDEDVSQAVREILEAEGIHIRLNAKCVSLAKRDGGVAVSLTCEEGQPEVAGTHILLAVGRTPNTSDLGLDRAGVTSDHRGYIMVDDQLQTNVPGIWALGDCNGRGAFTHTSYNDYEIVADNLFNADHRRISDRIQAYALYIDPPLGRCGMTDAEIQKSGRRVLTAKYPMSQVSRAYEKGETQGFIKIYVDAESKLILGAAILGVGGDEVIHVLLDVMYAKAPYTVIQRAMHIHPTVAEYLPIILSKLEPLA